MAVSRSECRELQSFTPLGGSTVIREGPQTQLDSTGEFHPVKRMESRTRPPRPLGFCWASSSRVLGGGGGATAAPAAPGPCSAALASPEQVQTLGLSLTSKF